MSADRSGIPWAMVVVNSLSALRLVLAATFPMFEGAWRALVIVIVAISDGLDGFIARRFNAATWIGGILDAVADKAFVLMVLVTYIAGGELNFYEVALLILRDFAVFCIVAYAVTLRLWEGFKQMPARLLGKLTTAAMFVLILLLALSDPAQPRPLHIQVVLGVTVLLSSLAAADYLATFLRAERSRRAG